MVRSEAIVVLNKLRNYYGNRQGGEENTQALDFAISSLLTDEAYQLEYENSNSLYEDLKQGLQEAIAYEKVEDCISRKQLIHEIINQECEVKGNVEWLNGHAKHQEQILELISKMPSVYPSYDISDYSDKLWRNAYKRGKMETLEDIKEIISEWEDGRISNVIVPCRVRAILNDKSREEQTGEIHCNYTDKEIADSFIDDVEKGLEQTGANT